MATLNNISSPLPEDMDTDLVASSPISARMENKEGSSSNSISISVSPAIRENGSMVEQPISISSYDISKECNKRKLEMVLKCFEQIKMDGLKERKKLMEELNELRAQVNNKDDMLRKQDCILSGQRDTIRTLHKLIKSAHLLNSQLRFEKHNGFHNTSKRSSFIAQHPDLQQSSPMVKTPSLMLSRTSNCPTGPTAQYAVNSSISRLSHVADSPSGVRSSMLSLLSGSSNERSATPLIDISDESLLSVTSVAAPARIHVKIDLNFKKKDTATYVMPDGRLCSPLSVPHQFKNRSVKSDIVKIRFPAIDRRDLENTGKIHGNIDYPKEARFCRIFYYIQSCHSNWLNCPSTPTRQTGSTKFTIEIPKELIKCDVPDRLIIFGLIESRSGGFYSERVMFPICDPVSSIGPSVSSIIQEMKSRPAHSIVVRNMSGNNFKSTTQSEQNSDVPTFRLIDTGDEYEVYRP